jgi:hypothetical protein
MSVLIIGVTVLAMAGFVYSGVRAYLAIQEMKKIEEEYYYYHATDDDFIEL